MELLEAGKENLHSYIELWFSLAKEMEKYSEVNKIIYNNAEEASEDGFIEQIESDKYSCYLIDEGDETLGFLVIKKGEHPSREHSQYTKIINLFIKENHRRQGYGAKAIEANSQGKQFRLS